MSNSTIAGNTTSFGGGGILNIGTMAVTNCTISGNSYQGYQDNGRVNGGGIYNETSLTLNNTIVAGNTGNDIYGQVQPTGAYNLIGDGSGLPPLATSNLIGTTANPLNSLLGPLANNGGSTQTMALLPGSPAIDAGSNALAVDANGNSLTTDQRGTGFPRILGHSVDIGAIIHPPQPDD